MHLASRRFAKFTVPATEVAAVASDKAGNPHPFDVKTVEYLIGLMAKHELNEIALQEGEHRIRLRKGLPASSQVVTAVPALPSAPAPQPAATPSSSVPPATKAASNLLEIKSEMVGTFYTRPAPGKDEYVKIGSTVKPETVVAIIVAMKVNNEITAGVSGRIVEICLKNEEPVDYGTVLFRVEPS